MKLSREKPPPVPRKRSPKCPHSRPRHLNPAPCPAPQGPARPPRATPRPRPDMSPARHPGGAGSGGRGAARRTGPGWRRCPRDARQGPRTLHPPSCPRAEPEGPLPPAHSLYKRLASRSRERVGGAAARAALRAASAAIKVRGQRCAEKQARPNLQAGLVGSLRARGHLS